MRSILKAFAVLILVGLSEGLANAQSPPLPPLPGVATSKLERVSLGVSLMKATEALYSQVPQLPKGCGFLLKTVTVGGTADKAGLKVMDLIWKLDDQILVNESQLMILLSHRKSGDKLEVSYFRSGKANKAELLLQPWSSLSPHPDVLAMNSSSLALPMRVISYEDRSASISDKTGTATLTYREGKPWLHVESDKGVETFNDFVSAEAEIAQVPVIWRSRLPALQRSLEESMRMRRLPRVRHVPRAVPKARVAAGQ